MKTSMRIELADGHLVLDERPGLHWLESRHARGWLRFDGGASPDARQVQAHLARAVSLGFVGADAAILSCTAALGGARLPVLSWGDAAMFAQQRAAAERPIGLYAIVDTPHRLEQVVAAGVDTVQLRVKTPAQPEASWDQRLRAAVQRSIDASNRSGAMLYVNDYWRLARELGAPGVHLGQEDLLALGPDGRAELLASGMRIGISSHSVWELCRARALAPAYIACGPVWPTTTKDMPWVPQGLDNLQWWSAMAGAPVTAIGGILDATQVREVSGAGADGVCVLRGLGDDPGAVVPLLQSALASGRTDLRAPAPEWPHPTLPRGAA